MQTSTTVSPPQEPVESLGYFSDHAETEPSPDIETVSQQLEHTRVLEESYRSSAMGQTGDTEKVFQGESSNKRRTQIDHDLNQLKQHRTVTEGDLEKMETRNTLALTVSEHTLTQACFDMADAHKQMAKAVLLIRDTYNFISSPQADRSKLEAARNIFSGLDASALALSAYLTSARENIKQYVSFSTSCNAQVRCASFLQELLVDYASIREKPMAKHFTKEEAVATFSAEVVQITNQSLFREILTTLDDVIEEKSKLEEKEAEPLQSSQAPTEKKDEQPTTVQKPKDVYENPAEPKANADVKNPTSQILGDKLLNLLGKTGTKPAIVPEEQKAA